MLVLQGATLLALWHFVVTDHICPLARLSSVQSRVSTNMPTVWAWFRVGGRSRQTRNVPNAWATLFILPPPPTNRGRSTWNYWHVDALHILTTTLNGYTADIYAHWYVYGESLEKLPELINCSGRRTVRNSIAPRQPRRWLSSEVDPLQKQFDNTQGEMRDIEALLNSVMPAGDEVQPYDPQHDMVDQATVTKRVADDYREFQRQSMWKRQRDGCMGTDQWHREIVGTAGRKKTADISTTHSRQQSSKTLRCHSRTPSRISITSRAFDFIMESCQCTIHSRHKGWHPHHITRRDSCIFETSSQSRFRSL